ncbi:hypothetical protein [Novipirellula caenicola]|uniref:Uncharacterized protein n=1 Tax=Novipirellula caenicola TaxID=1536901 RepID=A0ABP9VKK3_9BACT
MLIDRLKAVHPGWEEWDRLMALVTSLDFEFIATDYMGNFYVAGNRLCFSELGDEPTWPDWLPIYVPALYGMKADDWEMSGGYADSFDGEPARKGCVFSPAGNDADLGYPLINVPNDVYAFQTNSDGAVFFISRSLRMLYPNSENERFEELDSLEAFTRKTIQQVLDGHRWFDAYVDLKGSLLD